MSFRGSSLAARCFVIVSCAAAGLFGYGCSDDEGTLGANFAASATPSAAGLVKLVPNTASGAFVEVSAVIYGPVALDMYSFNFDVIIGNTNVLEFVPGSAVAGNALAPAGPQTVQATASVSVADPSRVVVDVHKDGGGLGNGVAGSSAIIVTLTFKAKMAGTSTLAIGSAPVPTAEDHNGAAIAAITFDSAGGTVSVITSGGGSY